MSSAQGRGRRETARRRARALADRPISASSAAACTAVLSTSWRRSGAGCSRRRRADGVPSGWAGWASRGAARVGFGFAGAPAAVGVAGADAAAGFAGVEAAFGFIGGEAAFGFVAAVAGFGPAPAARAAFGFDGSRGGAAAAASPGRAARLSLRRWGRERGSPPRTSEGGFSLT
jgi:hypothetical protein